VDRIAPYAHAIYRGLNGIAAKIQVRGMLVCFCAISSPIRSTNITENVQSTYAVEMMFGTNWGQSDSTLLYIPRVPHVGPVRLKTVLAFSLQAARPKPIHLSLPARSPMVMRRPSGVSRAPTPVALSRAVSETDLKAIDEDASAEDGMLMCGPKYRKRTRIILTRIKVVLDTLTPCATLQAR
jgi:hypothetical protein